MKVIAAFSTLDQAYLAVSRLESAGIRAELRDEATITLNWLFSPAIGGVKIAVPEADVESAQQILRMPPVEEGMLVCPFCGSTEVAVRTLNPAGAVLLATGLPVPLPLQTADCRKCGKSFDVKSHPNSP
jgi:hypothetical protein